MLIGRPAPPLRTEGDDATVRVGAVSLDPLTVDGAVDRVVDALDRNQGGLVVTPNVDILRLLEHPANADVIGRASMLVCDGAPLLLASRLAGVPLPGRVTGTALVHGLASAAATAGWSVAVVGGAPGVAAQAGRRLAQAYPGLEVRGAVCPPWGFEHEPETLAALVEEISTTGADLVFVGLGFPKQERLAIALRAVMPSTWFVGCGATVEFVAGTRRRAPRAVQRVGMEWAFRLAQEPRRLGRRYLADAVYLVPLLVRSAAAGAARRLSGPRARDAQADPAAGGGQVGDPDDAGDAPERATDGRASPARIASSAEPSVTLQS